MGILSLSKAREKAEQQQMDLVQMPNSGNPIVCRLMDYGKHLFELKKNQASSRKRHKKTQIKEIKFRLSTEEGDYQVKLRKMKQFLSAGDKTKVSLRLRGREAQRQDHALTLLSRISEDMKEYGSVEQAPQRMENRQFILTLAPTRKAGTTAKKTSDAIDSKTAKMESGTKVAAPTQS